MYLKKIEESDQQISFKMGYDMGNNTYDDRSILAYGALLHM